MSSTTAVRWGDFSGQAKFYSQRPPYAFDVLRCLVGLIQRDANDVHMAELGAGTGNLLRSFRDLPVSGYAIEPDPVMQKEAQRLSVGNRSFTGFKWFEATAEASSLPDASVDWVIIGNAYQFLDAERLFPECHRILGPGGYLTIIWNIRDFANDALHQGIEDMVNDMVPGLRRTSVSLDDVMRRVDTRNLFDEYIYIKQPYVQSYSPDSYLATWQAGGDVPSQVSPEKWDEIIAATRKMIPDEPEIKTKWVTRAWTYKSRRS